MADEAADAGGLPAKRDLLGTEDTLMSAPLRNSLGALHDLFAQAPLLGSLIDPRALQADLYQHDYESVRELLGAVLQKKGTNDEQAERAVAAQGMARAAELLAGRYHLVITNVPYLARGKQTDVLKQFAQDRHPEAKADLATLFVSRGFGWLEKHGVQALVTPQNWLFLTSYRKLREKLLRQRRGTWSRGWGNMHSKIPRPPVHSRQWSCCQRTGRHETGAWPASTSRRRGANGRSGRRRRRRCCGEIISYAPYDHFPVTTYRRRFV